MRRQSIYRTNPDYIARALMQSGFETHRAAANALGITPADFAQILTAESGITLARAKKLQEVFGSDAVTIRRN